MAMRRPSAYAALSAHYADDEAIMQAGEDAELLYIRMLAYAARTPKTDGWISDRVVTSRLGILPRELPDGTGNETGTDAGSRAGKLQEVGLISREGTGWRIVSWLKWNRSAEEIERERKRDSNRKTSGNDGNDTGSRAGNGAGVPGSFPTADTDTDTSLVRPDVDRLCGLLADLIESNGSKRPTIGKTWKTAARLLLDTDGRDLTEAERLIRWCQGDTFWAANVMSMPKFREKYDQLRMKAGGALGSRGTDNTYAHLPRLTADTPLPEYGNG